jgi:hypothetical protein
MFELKPLSREAIPAALEKANRYRLLNEPGEAESICQDVLRTDPENQQALVMLLLAITDQFGRGVGGSVSNAKEVVPRLRDEYERAYYSGIIVERRGKSLLQQGTAGAGFEAYQCLREAMTCFEMAEAIRPPGKEDSRLRWNACVRLISRHKLVPRPVEKLEMQLE